MKKRNVTAVTALILAGAITYNTAILHEANAKLDATPVAEPSAHYVDRAAVLSALNTRSQIVGLTGKVAKTVEFEDSAWYGDKAYELVATGTFKLGVDTADLIVTTSGNTVTVRFPQPKIISVDLPFDKAKLSKDVGLLRKDLKEGELQALYGKAREGAVNDIKRDRQAFDKAEASLERTIERLLAPVDGVENVEFEEVRD